MINIVTSVLVILLWKKRVMAIDSVNDNRVLHPLHCCIVALYFDEPHNWIGDDFKCKQNGTKNVNILSKLKE